MPKVEVPKHRQHKASGLGFVVLSSVQHYTGRWGTAEARRQYDSLLMRWIAGGRRPLGTAKGGATVADVVAAHVEALGAECRKRGKATGYVGRVKDGLAPVATMFGKMEAAEFGLDQIEAVQGHWKGYVAPRTGRRLTRGGINERVGFVVTAFQRAARRRLVPASVPAELALVEGLRKGRCDAPESRKVRPAPEASVEAVAAAVRDAAAAMLRLQRATGMRPGEVCGMRASDVAGRADGLLEYRVAADWNKNAHRGQERIVYLGPRAVEIVRPYLERAKAKGPGSPLFVTRKGRQYTTRSYSKVVAAVCRRLGVEPFSPQRVRHSRLTEVDEALGLEAAAAVGGHAGVETTRGYTERARETLAARVAREMG